VSQVVLAEAQVGLIVVYRLLVVKVFLAKEMLVGLVQHQVVIQVEAGEQVQLD
jgi:hypothetical protein